MAWFSDLPVHNQVGILKKLNDFKQFVRFKKCCRETKEIGDRFRHRLPLEGDFLYIDDETLQLHLKKGNKLPLQCAFGEPVRLIIRRVEVRSKTSNGMEIEEIIKRSGLTSAKLHVDKNNGCLSLATIDMVLKLLKANKLNIYNYSSGELLLLEELKNMRSIYFNGGVIHESEFLQLQAQKININKGGLSDSAITKFLKQWLEGKRKIEELRIYPVESSYNMVADLEHTELWSKYDDDLPYSHIEIEYNHPYDERLLHVFLLTRKEDEKRLIIGTSMCEEWAFLAMELEEDEDIEEWIRWHYE